MEQLRWLDFVIVFLYFVLVAWIGLRFSRRQNSTDAYFAARRSIPHWAMGVSMFATLISSITFIAYPGSAYAGTWSELYPMFMILIVLLLVGTVLVPFFRHAVGLSAYEYFGQRFGYGARAYSGLAFSAGHFSKMGFVLYLLSLTASSMTGWNIYGVLLITGVVTVLYTVFGGLEAVIWTDVIQGLIMCLGVLVILGILVFIMPGGVGAAFELASAKGKFSLGTPKLDFADKTSLWVMTLYGFFWFLQKYCADQTVVQRYLVAKSDHEALKGVALGALMCVPIWTLFMLIGTLLWCYYQLSGTTFPPDMLDKTGKVISDKVFPHFLVTKIPVGLSGLFMAAVFAAGMSTLSSDLNCLSAVGVEDYYRKLRPNASDARRLFMGKVIVGVCGLAAVGIAALIAWKSERVLSLYYAVSSIISGGLAGMFILAFLSRRSNKQGLWIGIIASLIFTAWATLTSGKNKMVDLGDYNFPWASVMIGVAAHVIVLVVGYLASFFFPPGGKAEWTLWGWLDKRKTGATTQP
ncbi:MAG TPA: sodium:solute symporter [Candidatus Paceibacterota bacterium]|nr:sodium:solute symporter [Verrucomicrobiota bacterium]HRY48542.1 sodium:solute symporter [Candidatus Paceibacterota bacterium]HRZ99547.1 sodium:solute symporter [Candidatus Paceibacterota bacterium]